MYSFGWCRCLSAKDSNSHFLVCIQVNFGELFHNTNLPGLDPWRFWVSWSGMEPRHLCFDAAESRGELSQHTAAWASSQNTDSHPLEVRGLGNLWCSPKDEKTWLNPAGNEWQTLFNTPEYTELGIGWKFFLVVKRHKRSENSVSREIALRLGDDDEADDNDENN